MLTVKSNNILESLEFAKLLDNTVGTLYLNKDSVETTRGNKE